MLKINDLKLAFSNSIVVEVNGELRLEAGEIALLTGATGSGKSTFLNALAGIFPTYTGGFFSGSISNSSENQAKEIPNFGYVFQNPFDGFVQNTVSQEIMFTINQFNLTPDFEWLNQISEVLGIQDLQDREVHSLSDGEGQRVAIAAALATKPRVLLLDEPTSALDSANTHEFLGLISQIAIELKVAIVVSEHRFEPLLEKVSQVWLIENSYLKTLSPAEFANLKQQDLQISQIARAAKIDPGVWELDVLKKSNQGFEPNIKVSQSNFASTSNVIQASNLTISKLGENILDEVSFDLKNGSTTAILGRSGAGKSTLLHSLIGDYPPVSGTLKLAGEAPAKLSAKNLLGKIALVPQQPGQLFVAETVSAECNFADRWRGLTVGTTLKTLDYFDAGINLNQHPRDLSAGQQLWLAISIATAANPSVLLLDEPTRGLDHYGMCLLQELIIKRQKSGLTTIWATHDLDAAASISDNLLVLSNGQLQSFGPPFASFHPALKKYTLLHQVYPNSEALSVQQLSSVVAE